MGLFDDLRSRLLPKVNQTEEFKKSVQNYKTQYVNLSKDELKSILARPSCEAEKVGVSELLYGVGVLGTVIPIATNLIELTKTISKNGKLSSKNQEEEEDPEEQTGDPGVGTEEDKISPDAANGGEEETAPADAEEVDEEETEDEEEDEEDDDNDDDDDEDILNLL